MMEDRINKIEKELYVMSQTQLTMSNSLEKISKTLDKISTLFTDLSLMQQKVEFLHLNAEEAIKRTHIRIDKLEKDNDKLKNIFIKLIWIIITPIIISLVSYGVMKGN